MLVGKGWQYNVFHRSIQLAQQVQAFLTVLQQHATAGSQQAAFSQMKGIELIFYLAPMVLCLVAVFVAFCCLCSCCTCRFRALLDVVAAVWAASFAASLANKQRKHKEATHAAAATSSKKQKQHRQKKVIKELQGMTP